MRTIAPICLHKTCGCERKSLVYRPRRKANLAFVTRIMGRRIAMLAAITRIGAAAAIMLRGTSSPAFSSACSVKLGAGAELLQVPLSYLTLRSPASPARAPVDAGIDEAVSVVLVSPRVNSPRRNAPDCVEPLVAPA
jgi:hypothetical protein